MKAAMETVGKSPRVKKYKSVLYVKQALCKNMCPLGFLLRRQLYRLDYMDVY